MKPVLNYKQVLIGLSEDLCLKEYKIKVQENPKGVATQIVFAKNEAQAIRIARRYLELKGTLEIYDHVAWEERLYPDAKSDPHYYEDPEGFYLEETEEENDITQ